MKATRHNLPKLEIEHSRNHSFQRGPQTPKFPLKKGQLPLLKGTPLQPNSAKIANKIDFLDSSQTFDGRKSTIKYMPKSPQPYIPSKFKFQKKPIKRKAESTIFPKIEINEAEESKNKDNSDDSERDFCLSRSNSENIGVTQAPPSKPKIEEESKFMWKGGPKTGGLFVPMNEDLLYSIRALRLCYRSKLLPGNSKLIPFNKSLGADAEKKLKILILDLDQTLVYEMSKQNLRKMRKGSRTIQKLRLATPSAKMELEPPPENKTTNPMLVRPYLKKFLYNMKPFYEIVIFSTQDRDHVKRALDKIDPEGIFISGFLCSENLSELEIEEEEKVVKVKSLEVILGADKKDCVILDDTMHLWPFDLDNLIVAEPFTGDILDTFLPRITHLLVKLATTENVVQEIKVKSTEILEIKKTSGS